MKITGRFATRDNSHTIKVTIYNKEVTGADINIDTSHNVKFAGDSPVIISQQQDDTFEHILKTQCKIRLVAKSWLGKYLYASNWTSICVNVWVDDDCVFCGLVQPNTYNQDYSHLWEEIEINAYDVLSTLKDKRLTDTTDYNELVSQSKIQNFKWYIEQMNLTDTSIVIPNLPDANTQYMEMAWFETGWTRNVNDDGSITYYAIESECMIYDTATAVATGNERQGEQKYPTWVASEDTVIVDGVPHYKEYSHITIAEEDVNTGDWRAGESASDSLPELESTTIDLTGWTKDINEPVPFEYYEKMTVSYVYSNGMSMTAYDVIGDQIPQLPLTTANNSYWDYVQSNRHDVYVDQTTGYEYYKLYGYVTVDNVSENSYDWIQGPRTPYVTGYESSVSGWRYGVPETPFEYYERLSYDTVYSDGTREFAYFALGDYIPATPNATSYGSAYELRQADKSDYTTYDGYKYYKNYAWIRVGANGDFEQTTDWERGTIIPYIVGRNDVITNWQRNSAFNYYETVSSYDVYSDGSEELNYTYLGDQIPLEPNSTTYGSYYYLQQGDESDTTIYNGLDYYKDYAYVWFNDTATNTQDWQRGRRASQPSIWGTVYEPGLTAPKLIYTYNGITTTYNPIYETGTRYFEYDLLPEGITYFNFGYLTGNTWSDDIPNRYNVSTLHFRDIDSYNVSNMGLVLSNFSYMTNVNIDAVETDSATNMLSMFGNCSYLTNFNTSYMNTENVVIMDLMFEQCERVTSLDLSNFDTTSATSMMAMFSGCRSLTYLNVSSFDTTNVTNMSSMFSGCWSLTSLDLSNFDTQSATSMAQMFRNCYELTSLDLSNFDTDDVTTVKGIFENCTHMQTLDISNWDLNNVAFTYNERTGKYTTNMDNMFSQCPGTMTITMDNMDEDTFDHITTKEVTKLSTSVVIYRDGDTYRYSSSTNKWVQQ